MGQFKFMCKTEEYADGSEGYFWSVIEGDEDDYQETGDDVFVYKGQIINNKTESNIANEAFDQTENNQIDSNWEHYDEEYSNSEDAYNAMMIVIEKYHL